jgi:hypothetical protein
MIIKNNCPRKARKSHNTIETVKVLSKSGWKDIYHRKHRGHGVLTALTLCLPWLDVGRNKPVRAKAKTGVPGFRLPEKLPLLGNCSCVALPPASMQSCSRPLPTSMGSPASSVVSFLNRMLSQSRLLFVLFVDSSSYKSRIFHGNHLNPAVFSTPCAKYRHPGNTEFQSAYRYGLRL